MSFQQAVLGVLVEGRRLAESLMVDTCVVTREDPDGEPDDVTGERPRVEVYAGRAKIQTQDQYEQTPEAGAFRYTIQRYYAHVPVGSYRPAVGDVVTIVTAALDLGLAGREFRVVGLLHKSMATAYRLALQDGVSTQPSA